MSLTRLVLLLPLLLASACGFELRDNGELPAAMATTRLVIANPESDFARGLERGLRRAGADITASPERASATLAVTVNRVSQEILSIGANSRVREISIRHQVSFRLLDAAGDPLMPLQQLELSRPLNFDETEILASSREQEAVRRELADSMVREVLLRLGRVDTIPDAAAKPGS